MNSNVIDYAISKMLSLYEWSAVGGNLHIVTDDGNLDDDHIESCKQSINGNIADATPEQLAIENELVSIFENMSQDERKAAYDKFWDIY